MSFGQKHVLKHVVDVLKQVGGCAKAGHLMSFGQKKRLKHIKHVLKQVD